MRALKILFIAATLASTPIHADEAMTLEKLEKTGARDCPAKLTKYKPTTYKDVCKPMADCNNDPVCDKTVAVCQKQVDAQQQKIRTYNDFIDKCADNPSRLDKRIETKKLNALLQSAIPK